MRLKWFLFSSMELEKLQVVQPLKEERFQHVCDRMEICIQRE